MAWLYSHLYPLCFSFLHRLFSLHEEKKAAKKKDYNPIGSRISTTSIRIPRIFR